VQALENLNLPAANEDEWARPGITDAGLTLHRDRVVDALAAISGSPAVRAKYEWTAAYHNYICVEFYERGDLIIPNVSVMPFKRFA
jgi:hypothetical protein